MVITKVGLIANGYLFVEANTGGREYTRNDMEEMVYIKQVADVCGSFSVALR